MHVPKLSWKKVDEMARPSSTFRSFLASVTGIGCLHGGSAHDLNYKSCSSTHFLASKKILPNNFGIDGMILASHKKISWAFINARRASNGLCFPRSLSSPTTRSTNLMLCAARRSLYSRWGFLTKRQTEDLGGGGSAG